MGSTFPHALSSLDIQRKLARLADQPAGLVGDANPVNRLKCAAVLIPIFLEKGDWSIVLTKRTQVVNDHKGQVSFPGGACEPADRTIIQTALREAEEEIGLRGEDVCVVGSLAPFETRNTYRIHPVVGTIPWPYPFHPSRDEVERVFTIPLAWLADQQHRTVKDYHGFPVIVFDLYDGELLWGISAHITVHFLEILTSG